MVIVPTPNICFKSSDIATCLFVLFTIVDIKEQSTLADSFIIVSGTSNTHIKALADNVEVELKKENIYPNKIEGYNTEWILMDYGDIVVHIFTQKERQNYNIEEF